MTTPQRFELRTLLGARDLSTALYCLRTIASHVANLSAITVHSDGTLTANDVAILKSSVGCPVIVVTPEEADDVVIPQMKGYPALNQLRRRLPHARKVLDIVLMCSDTTIYYCDSDIVVFKPVHDLFPVTKNDALFFPDINSGYSIPYYSPLVLHRLQFASRINTGLFAFPRSQVDFSYMEFLCSKDVLHKGWPLFVEQTLWAALAMRVRSFLYDPRQAVIVTDRTMWNDDIVIGHFVSTWRTRLAELKDRNFQADSAVKLAIQSTHRLSAFEFLWEQGRFRLERLLGRGR